MDSGDPFDDPSERPTRMAEYRVDGSLQQVLDDEPDWADEGADAAEPDFAPEIGRAHV